LAWSFFVRTVYDIVIPERPMLIIFEVDDLLKKLLPSMFINSIYDLQIDQLKKSGIKGIITDLDNTLIEWNRPNATPELVNWFHSLRDSGFRIIVVSNNNHERVRKFAEPHGIPYIPAAKKPMKRAFKEAMRRLELSAHEVVVIGDQLFTDILGGNRLGIYSILVVPIASTDAFITRFNRMMERNVLQWFRKKGLLSWEEK
jgi:HAD superfamily phosphatase (TIGR01668 family)